MNFNQVPQEIIRAIVASNRVRKDFIADEVLKIKSETIGFHRIVMKEGSDNFRSSAIQGIIKRLKGKGKKIILYEPLLEHDQFYGLDVVNDLDKFKSLSEIIITNRHSEELTDVMNKVFTRDLFNRD